MGTSRYVKKKFAFKGYMGKIAKITKKADK
jgi:hypothetical protein